MKINFITLNAGYWLLLPRSLKLWNYTPFDGIVDSDYLWEEHPRTLNSPNNPVITPYAILFDSLDTMINFIKSFKKPFVTLFLWSWEYKDFKGPTVFLASEEDYFPEMFNSGKYKNCWLEMKTIELLEDSLDPIKEIFIK